MSARSLEFTPYVPKNESLPRLLARHAAKMFHRRLLEYSDADRGSARMHVEHVFGARFAFTPQAHVLFRPPEKGPVAKEFDSAPNPVAKFRRDGYVGWQLGMDTYFNGWKAKSADELRMAVLEHEFAHVLLAQKLLENGTAMFDLDAYSHATEGIATYAENECRRAYGYKTPLLKRMLRKIKNSAAALMEIVRHPGRETQPPEPGDDEIYSVGLRFFTALAEKYGAKEAFRMLSTDLPRNMDEIYHPSIYTYRVLGEYC